MLTKKCNKCNLDLLLDLFSKDKTKKDGKSTQCKSCREEYRREWISSNKDKKASLDKQYRLNNLDNIKMKKQQYYQDNKESILRINSIWKSENVIKYSQSNRLYAINNKPKISLIKKAYKHRRRSKEKSILSANVLSNWISTQVSICPYCNKSLNNESFHIDHIDPLSKDGVHELSNLTVSCPSCNLHKSSKSLICFMATR